MTPATIAARVIIFWIIAPPRETREVQPPHRGPSGICGRCRIRRGIHRRDGFLDACLSSQWRARDSPAREIARVPESTLTGLFITASENGPTECECDDRAACD